MLRKNFIRRLQPACYFRSQRQKGPQGILYRPSGPHDQRLQLGIECESFQHCIELVSGFLAFAFEVSETMP